MSKNLKIPLTLPILGKTVDLSIASIATGLAAEFKIFCFHGKFHTKYSVLKIFLILLFKREKFRVINNVTFFVKNRCFSSIFNFNLYQTQYFIEKYPRHYTYILYEISRRIQIWVQYVGKKEWIARKSKISRKIRSSRYRYKNLFPTSQKMNGFSSLGRVSVPYLWVFSRYDHLHTIFHDIFHFLGTLKAWHAYRCFLRFPNFQLTQLTNKIKVQRVYKKVKIAFGAKF